MPDREESRSGAYSISRYRLSLIREAAEAISLPRSCRWPAEAAEILHRIVHDEPREVMGALLLDSARRVIGYTVAYRGILNRALVEPRGLLLPALLANAAAVILFHNHPSGDLLPSKEDLAVTKRLQDAGDILGVTVHDHLILGDPPAYYSMFQAENAKGVRRRKSTKRAKPKYRHPETGETWAGRGKMANWLKREIEAGRRLEEYAVKQKKPGGCQRAAKLSKDRSKGE